MIKRTLLFIFKCLHEANMLFFLMIEMSSYKLSAHTMLPWTTGKHSDFSDAVEE